MPSEPKEPTTATTSTRQSRPALLQKQPEIEEVDEEDTSPSSDQSDSTITAGGESSQVAGGDSPENGSADDLTLKPAVQKLNHISPKMKQLTRSEALCEECASPPLDPLNLKSTASTCSSDSSSSGIGTKSSITSGSLSGSSFHGVLEKTGSQSSEAGTSSSLSRDSSVDTPYKDSTGIDLEEFIRRTLNKTPKDRSMLIKLEVDLIKFIREPKHHYLKFPQMSSYDRMLVHRIAAFFGLDHNVDQTGKCVIVNKTANTRIPDFSFQEAISKGDDSKPMMLLKRGGNSFDDSISRNLQKPSMGQMNKAKSLEERQQNYTEVRNRIFTDEEVAEAQPIGYCQEDAKITGIVRKPDRPQSLGSNKEENPWSSTESSGYETDRMGKATRVFVPKANSFGGTGTFVLQHMKSPMHNSLSKADSLSYGGYNLQPNFNSPQMRSLLISSPTQCSPSDKSSVSGNSSRLAPSPQQQQPQQGSVPAPGQHVYWVASDLNSIPAGSVLINPQTGQPFMNADGSTHKYIPGQPLPQQGAGYNAGPQQQQPVYQVSPDWASHSQESVSSQEVCQQLSVMQLTPQSSVESGAGGDSISVQPHQQHTQQILMNQNVQQQQGFSQQPIAGTPQGVYYQGSPSVQGQQQSVRFMCPMNYGSPNQGSHTQQGFGPTPTVLVDGNNQGQQAYPTHQYCQQFVQGYQGNQMYSMTSQDQTIGGQGQSCDYQSASAYSVTSPVEGPSSVVTGGYCYPVSYSQQQTVVAPNQTTPMYYTVQNPQSNPTQTAQGYVQYSGQQGTTYQTNTSPPSQNSTLTPNVQQQMESAVATQPINMNNMSSVNTVAQQQPQSGVVQGMGSVGAVTPSPGGQYMTSFPSSHQMMSHTPHFHQPTAFTSPVRPMAPQVVPIPGGVTVHGHGQTTPMAQAFHPVYRPNMQMPMQIYSAGTQQAQQPLIIAGGAGMNKAVSGQSGHVTVSAKNVQYEGRVENGGGENGDSVPVCASDTLTGIRQHHHNQGEIRMQYKPQHGRAQVQTVRLPHSSQTNTRSSPTAPKPQRSKTHGRTSEHTQHSIHSGCGNGEAMSHVLEVCEISTALPLSEHINIFSALEAKGATLKCSNGDIHAGMMDFNSRNRAMSPNARLYAVFPDNTTAAHILNTHSGNTYKLRVVDSIEDSHV